MYFLIHLASSVFSCSKFFSYHHYSFLHHLWCHLFSIAQIFFFTTIQFPIPTTMSFVFNDSNPVDKQVLFLLSNCHSFCSKFLFFLRLQLLIPPLIIVTNTFCKVPNRRLYIWRFPWDNDQNPLKKQID